MGGFLGKYAREHFCETKCTPDDPASAICGSIHKDEVEAVMCDLECKQGSDSKCDKRPGYTPSASMAKGVESYGGYAGWCQYTANRADNPEEKCKEPGMVSSDCIWHIVYDGKC